MSKRLVSGEDAIVVNDKGNVGVRTPSPSSNFHVKGSFAHEVRTVTSSSVVAGDETVILCDTSSNNITVTLPPASGVTDRAYHIKKTDSSANKITIDGNASETIDGDTTVDISIQYESYQIVCDGSNWFVI